MLGVIRDIPLYICRHNAGVLYIGVTVDIHKLVTINTALAIMVFPNLLVTQLIVRLIVEVPISGVKLSDLPFLFLSSWCPKVFVMNEA